jgi:hypothetical protein
MTTSEIKVNNQNVRLVKLAAVHGSKPVISDKEKAVFALE